MRLGASIAPIGEKIASAAGTLRGTGVDGVLGAESPLKGLGGSEGGTVHQDLQTGRIGGDRDACGDDGLIDGNGAASRRGRER